MAPHLRVLVGPSPDKLVPISAIVNTNQPHKISSDLFEGEVVVNIKGFTDNAGQVRDSEYFNRDDRQGVTWSIQVQGRFLAPCSADDVLFGNTFDRPLKLPWGSGAALKFMSYIDPTLEHNLTSPTKPWALSPLVATMPYFMHTHIRKSRSSSDSESDSGLLKPPERVPKLICLPPFPPLESIEDDTSQLHLTTATGHKDDDARHAALGSISSASSSSASINSTQSSASTPSSFTSSSSSLTSGSKGGSIKSVVKSVKRKRTRKSHASICGGLGLETASQRRSHFSSAAARQAVTFGPQDVVTTDFCYGFLEFSPSLALRLPGGMSFDLMKYWDKQPVRFVCCERRKFGEGEDSAKGEGDPWGRIFWCVSIEMDEGHDGE